MRPSTHGGARLLEIDPHRHEDVVGEAIGDALQALGVFQSRLGVVYRTRSDDC